MKRLPVLAAALSASVLLTACHQNPLTANDSKQTAEFLMKGSMAYEKKADMRETGTSYKQCMTENILNVDCPKLFAEMIRVAQSTKAFKSLNVSDLTDKEAYKKIASVYDSTLFNRI